MHRLFGYALASTTKNHSTWKSVALLTNTNTCALLNVYKQIKPAGKWADKQNSQLYIFYTHAHFGAVSFIMYVKQIN